jgi:hypothetical protein
MSTRHTHHRIVISAIVCALLASALTNVAPAGASQRTLLAGARAQERYYASFGKSRAIDPARLAAAKAQGRYYASYGHPQPLPPPQRPQPSDGTPWLPITLAVAAAMAVIAAGSTAARRLRLRRPTRVAS